MNYGSLKIVTTPATLLNIDGKKVAGLAVAISFGSKPVKLTSLESAFVLALALDSGVTMSKPAILAAVYGNGGTYKKIDPKAAARVAGIPEHKIVDVVLCKTRRKMQAVSGEASPINTVWGEGYNLPKATRAA